MKHIIVLIALILIGIAWGCNKEGADPIFIYNITDEFKMSMVEKLNVHDRRDVIMTFTTVQPQPCSNIELNITSKRYSSQIDIYIDGLQVVGDCDQSETTITKDILIEDVSLDATYSINIYIKDEIASQGTLTTTDNCYLLKLLRSPGIATDSLRLYRLPTDMIYGFISMNEGNEQSMTHFVNEIIQEVDTDYRLPKGTYTDFDAAISPITGQDTIYFHTSPIMLSDQHVFAYKLMPNTDIDVLHTIFNYFKYKLGDDMSSRLIIGSSAEVLYNIKHDDNNTIIQAIATP